MKFAIYDDAGVILRKGDVPEEEIPNYAQTGEHIFSGEADYVDLIDVSTGALIANGMGPRPGPDYTWDLTAKKWNEAAASVRARLKTAIETERDRRIFAVLTIDSSDYDADPRSQQNVADTLASINSREQLALAPMDPSVCVWRDHANVTHSFTDQTAYKSWLANFAVMLADRGTAAYAWSWQKKASLNAASDDSLSTFDPTS
jgi:hypothetical protein